MCNASSCASCGIAEVDDIKLSECDNCDLVRYCSDECKENHHQQHEEACKKRAAELRDELLFKQPESTHLGDCPICCLPMPLDAINIPKYCCSKLICNGCNLANMMRETQNAAGTDTPHYTCPFCREPKAFTREEVDRQIMKRVEMNDPSAISRMGKEQYDKGDYARACECFAKAAQLGDVVAHAYLSEMYRYGQGVERDEAKEIHYLEEAAIGGDPEARYNIGTIELRKGNTERAVKHYTIAAAQGEKNAIKALIHAFKRGSVEKDVLAVSLRAHKAAVDATKSPQRKQAKELEHGI